ncbi:MAG: thioredoxin-disulfide reductase [Oscillospiraceae bacterium]|nr:thioredoxin-disulfide reductase [Oscillospiraceae bacterium]
MYDVIIIGGGPGGMTAAIYSARAGLKTLMLEKLGLGGQAALTFEIDNYPGFPDTISGMELSAKFKMQVIRFGAEIKMEHVKSIEVNPDGTKTVFTRKGQYSTKKLILSLGTKPKKLETDGEDRLSGAGVSYCATCDGALFKGQKTMVVGGGDTAFTDAVYLSKYSTEVTLVHRSDSFRANRLLVERVRENPKVRIVTDSVVKKIIGDSCVKGVEIFSKVSGESSMIDTAALFVAIGTQPQTELVRELVKLDRNGFVLTDEHMMTNIDGIYAVGDMRVTPLRQIITAAADGAVAAAHAALNV